MLRNWLTVALRNLARHRLYTAINVLGLAVGLAAALLIGVFVKHELSYDGFHAQADRIVRVDRVDARQGQRAERTSVVQMPLGPALAARHPEVEAVARVATVRIIARLGSEAQYEWLTLVDPAFLALFDFPFLAGDPATALAAPNTVVLTEKAAARYFGGEPALGRTLQLADGRAYQVTGVLKDLPTNTHLDFSMLSSLATPNADVERTERRPWDNSWIKTYLLLKPGTDVAALQAAANAGLPGIVPDFQAQAEGGRPGWGLQLQPLRAIHTDPGVHDGGTSWDVLVAFSLAAVLVLVIAVINFVNLATARSALRAREVALRKTLGGQRSHIVVQFMAESLLLALLSGMVAVALVELSLPSLQQALGLRLDAAFQWPGLLAGMVLPLVLLVGLLGGVYPAFVLSAYRPAPVLRGGEVALGGRGRLRAALVVFQFAVAIALMIGTAVILAQTDYARSARLGFDKENVVLLRGLDNRGVDGKLDLLLTRLRAVPGVEVVSASAAVPGDWSVSTSSMRRAGEGEDRNRPTRVESVAFGYHEALRTPVLAGRTFDPARPGDMVPDAAARKAGDLEGSVVLAEAALPWFGFKDPEEAVGQGIIIPFDEGPLALTIIGVVEDIKFHSARINVGPTIFTATAEDMTTAIIRIAPGAAPAVLERIDQAWKEMFPDIPVRRQFLDDRIELLYATEMRQGQVLAVFTGIAILIACLGLFGLAAFTAERRTREIGLRKVLGASVPSIVRLLVWQFSRPVLVANLIAWPVAWFALSWWLQGFAYRIELGPLPFLAAGAITLAIAWATVAGQAARVAVRKPALALRHE